MNDSPDTPSAKAPRRNRRDKEATKARILASAEAVFASKGFEGARVREVAAGADVHHALVHHYFGDKVGLFSAVIRRAFDDVSMRALELLRAGADIRSVIEAYVTMLIEFHAEHPNLVRLLQYASMDKDSPAYAVTEEITRELSGNVMGAVGRAVEAAQRAGVLRADIDARRLVGLSVGAVAYVFHEDRFFSLFHGAEVREPASVAAHREAALAFIMAAVKP